jgi:hypothetical protein
VEGSAALVVVDVPAEDVTVVEDVLELVLSFDFA